MSNTAPLDLHDIELPETRQELELLLEALHALNEALEACERRAA